MRLFDNDLILFIQGYYNLMMKSYTAIVEKCHDTGLFVGYIPGFKGAHSQA